MAKTFYTERDIEDMRNNGTGTLVLNDNVVLTDLAYEKAHTLGLKLVREQESVPCAPVRPYLAKTTIPQQTSYTDMVAKAMQVIGEKRQPVAAADDELHRRIRSAVLAKVGDIDVALLDRIIARVLDNLGMRNT